MPQLAGELLQSAYALRSVTDNVPSTHLVELSYKPRSKHRYNVEPFGDLVDWRSTRHRAESVPGVR